MAKILNYQGLLHLIERLDLRYIDTDETISAAIIQAILNGTITLEELEAAAAAASSSGSSSGGDDNSTGDRANRVLNYPGLQHLIQRLDLRYFRAAEELHAATADRLSEARAIEISGEASGIGYFDGSQDLNIYANVSHITNTELEAMLV